MKLPTLVTLCCIAIIGTLTAQSGYWQKTSLSEIQLPAHAERSPLPDHYELYQLDRNGVRQALQPALQQAGAQKAVVLLPMPNGQLEAFEVQEASNMHPQLAARYPLIRSFSGRGIRQREAVVRLGYSPRGFHAAIATNEGTIAIDPLASGPTDYYMTYHTRDFVPEQPFVCGVEGEMGVLPDIQEMGLNFDDTPPSSAQMRGGAAVVDLLQYDMALACTGEFANIHGGTVDGVMAAFDIAMGRLNLIFEQEVAVRFQLVEDNDKIIFTDPNTDPYENANVGGELLDQNKFLLDGLINSYDIGHVFTAGCTDVGGVAGGSVCGDNRGRGVTCNFSSNILFIVSEIMAHEVGHQFSAGHTWSNCPGIMGQLASASAFEPGSGSTIMSYSGSCGAQNVQFGSDMYFHVGTLTQITNFSRRPSSPGAGCPDVVPTSNSYPEIDWPYENGFYIPISTPFELNAVATDADGDELTYCWEQYDLGPTSPLGMPFGNAPAFRTYPPNENTNRVFPQMMDVVNNTSSIVEVLPTYSRDLTFRLTARDNNPEVGGTVWEEVAFKATDAAGPFRVLHPNNNVSWEVGQYTEVSWEVANTDLSPVNCSHVNIKMSVDGGYTYPYMLAAGALNDGSQFVTVPDTITNRVRIRVEAAENIFFDISNTNFEIVAASEPGYTLEISPFSRMICLPEGAQFDIHTSSILGYDSLVHFEISGLPPLAEATFSQNPLIPSETAQLSINLDNVEVEGTYEMEIMAIAPGVDTAYRHVTLGLVYSNFSDLALLEPTDGSNGLEELVEFSWIGSPYADSYDIEIATSPAFGNTIIESASGITETSFTPSKLLEKNTQYFWRVRPVNVCGPGDFTGIYALHTEVLSCAAFESEDVPVFISSVGLSTVESTIHIIVDGEINDFNIPKIKGIHDLIKHLDMSLISPDGTEVLLFSDICGNTTLLNIGFDDQAPSEIPCPPIGGQVHRPQESLSAFHGESTAGPWKLRMEVTHENGEGGALEEWSMQFCSNVTLSPPFLVINDTLPVPPGQTNTISRNFLLVDDADTPAEDITFTVVSIPQHGALYKINTPLQVGSTFSQASLNSGNIRYLHNGSNTQFDHFTFTVSDPEGGWFGQPQFNFKIDQDAVVPTYELDKLLSVELFPNPAKDELYLFFGEAPPQHSSLSIYNMQGQLVLRNVLDSRALTQAVSTRLLTDGMYILTIESEEARLSKKLVIQR